MSVEESPAVQRWLGRLAPSTAQRNRLILNRWMRWLRQSKTGFSKATPDELITHQKAAGNGELYDILDDVVQPFISQLNGRYNYKMREYSGIRSFFAHNRAELPKDTTFKIRGDTEKVRGLLTAEDLRNLILASNPMYRAIFLSMFQGGMGLTEFEYWNLNGWEETRKQLEDMGDNFTMLKVNLPGRKGARNRSPYYTLLNRDAVDALKNYVDYHRLKNSKVKTSKAIFVSSRGKPILKQTVYQYWNRHLGKIGLTKPIPRSKSHRTGRNPHEMRDVFRSQWEKSPAKGSVAEFALGHKVDPLEYNKAHMDESWVRKEFSNAAPLLNIMSSDRPFGKVGEDEIEKLRTRIQELEKEKKEYTGKYEDLIGRMEELSRQFRAHLEQEK